MRMRFSMGLPGTSFDPANLTLTGWWRASFSASPWSGTASAGTSGSENLSEGTNAPSSGTAVNGLNPATFDGTNDVLAGSSVTSFYSNSAYGMLALIKVNSFTIADPGAAAPYSCPSILGAPGGSGSIYGGPAGSGGTGVFRFGHYDGATYNSASAAISTAAWTMVAAWYDGTTIRVSVNNGTAGTATHSNASGINGFIKCGPNFGAAQFLDTSILEGATKASDWTADELAGWKTYFNSRYGLSL